MKRLLLAGLIAAALCPLAGQAADDPPAAPPATAQPAPAPAVDASALLPAFAAAEPAPASPTARNGRDIFQTFLAGRADAGCDAEQTSPRWQQHFSHAPSRMANEDDDVLPLFGYVVDELREAGLPTEFALIPFVESGYRPGARNGSGPAGLWQFIATTARNHQVPVGKSYDGRLSAVDSTDAAVRYLKTLYGMFGGDWRLTIMAYNAGEYRLLQSLRRAGMNAQNAQPAKLPGLSPVTYAYVEKLHALACVLDKAQAEDGLMAALDRPVPILTEHTLPAGASLAQWAKQRDLEPTMVGRLNPALASKANGAQRALLAPALDPQVAANADAEPLPTVVATTVAEADDDTPATPRKSGKKTTASARTHTVRNGESAWTIAKRYGIPVKTLLSRNGLKAGSVLKPGMVLAFDAKP
ncbi:lytic transglycosylase [Stenotrophomonas panacihumi]|uniref:Lytic transglycosylase n=1 Tax=Stenotrophomonas panacihumi TaxID=676599 RepID=A0A0R0A0A4_9GAMM|nr:lytic transglycosylase domain-containing protein [Stenotrophomonas panacihumi]KRG38630.1 lytic transglycosylase [Stenotrophomonas panacihumi]PTN54095.1 lytic transglycosylase [Stenotrophomonas panacihumi]